MDTDDSGNNDSAGLGNMSLENILVTMNKGVLKKKHSDKSLLMKHWGQKKSSSQNWNNLTNLSK